MNATGILMTIDRTEFRHVLGQFATGVTVVTTRDGSGRPQGLTANAFCSVSLVPPLVLVCIDRRADAHGAVAQAQAFNVSLLAEGQEEISQRFAFGGDTKFDGLALDAGENGLPLIPGAIGIIECTLDASHPAGDHTIYVGEVRRLQAVGGRPLVYHASGYRRLASESDAR